MTGRVFVLGSVNVDLLASVPRLPSAGETVAGDSLARQLGGKGANQAVAAARAGVAATLLASVGDDVEGTMMIETLKGFGVDVSSINRVSASTGSALVVTSPRDNQIVVIPGANALIDERLATRIDCKPGDIVLTQMETPPTAALALFSRARAAGATTILNAAPMSDAVKALLPLTDILVLNESELELLTATPIDGDATHADFVCAFSSNGLSAVPTAVVTLGAQGVVVLGREGLLRVPGQPATVVDTTGAGDCFCGYLAAGLARGDELVLAVVEANVAASVAVQSLGAASSAPVRSRILPEIAAAQRKV
jgi:ribokinase